MKKAILLYIIILLIKSLTLICKEQSKLQSRLITQKSSSPLLKDMPLFLLEDIFSLNNNLSKTWAFLRLRISQRTQAKSISHKSLSSLEDPQLNQLQLYFLKPYKERISNSKTNKWWSQVPKYQELLNSIILSLCLHLTLQRNCCLLWNQT